MQILSHQRHWPQTRVALRVFAVHLMSDDAYAYHKLFIRLAILGQHLGRHGEIFSPHP